MLVGGAVERYQAGERWRHVIRHSFVLADDPASRLSRALHSVVVEETCSLEEAAARSEAFRLWDPDVPFTRRSIRHIHTVAPDGRTRSFAQTLELPDGSRVTEFRFYPVERP
jgi:hypothetical protein